MRRGPGACTPGFWKRRRSACSTQNVFCLTAAKKAPAGKDAGKDAAAKPAPKEAPATGEIDGAPAGRAEPGGSSPASGSLLRSVLPTAPRLTALPYSQPSRAPQRLQGGA